MKCIDENQGDFYGFESWGKGVYQEIVNSEKIVYVNSFSDEDGNSVGDMPETLIMLTFIEHEGKTKLINRAHYASNEALKTVLDMGMEQGITETWDRLAEHLQSFQ